MRSTQLWVSLAIVVLPAAAVAGPFLSGRGGDRIVDVPVHESITLLGTGIALGVGALLIPTYLQGGGRATSWVAAGFLAYAGLSLWGGLVPNASVEAARLAYGAPARLLFAGSLLFLFSKSVEAERHRRRVALLILFGVAAVMALGFALAPVLGGADLRAAEALASLVALVVLIRVLWTRRVTVDPSPAPVLGAGWLLVQSVAFSFAAPWTLAWWMAHYIGIGGLLAIGWAFLVVPTAPRHVEELRQEAREDRLNLWLVNNAIFGLRTPLTPMKLQLHILRKGFGPDAPKDALQSIEILDRNVDRMSRMVDTVLDFARLQVGKLELRQLAFGLNSVVGETLRHFQPMADQNGVRLVLDIAGEVRVRADSARVAQVLSNLLSNSVRFTPKGGEVHVSTRRENAFGVVSVRDTGAGLNAGQVQKFNLSLAQLHQAGQGPDTGVGLGLYLSKGLVERMGGRLSAESPGPGRGATFQFTVPIAEASLAETDVPLAARALP